MRFGKTLDSVAPHVLAIGKRQEKKDKTEVVSVA